MFVLLFFFQAEDGILDLVRSRGLGDVYKRQVGADQRVSLLHGDADRTRARAERTTLAGGLGAAAGSYTHLTLPTGDLV